MDSINYNYEQKDELLRKSEISLWINSYDDIFSDFDPRSYKERALSIDFLEEIKRASKDKNSEPINLNFLISKEKRNTSHELLIIKRLREHFKKHHHLLQSERKITIKKGISFAFVGILLMIAATLILFNFGTNTFLTSFLVIFFEPSGWFFFWEGLYMVVFESETKKSDREFYKKMTKCNISFINY